ncbi:hypothetical protein AMECASPLE_037184 [Ameca splendens]|uniref:Uncharacterized protein n=1 Tax=Ameca splendens TaxID=208324 RepID=A0ABV0ZJ23_9TELE
MVRLDKRFPFFLQRQHSSTYTTRSMASVGTIRLYLACNTGYIMGYDLHAICESCLGPDHANLALTPQSTCPSCMASSSGGEETADSLFLPAGRGIPRSGPMLPR